MGRMFSPDGKLFAIVDRAADFAILSLLWLVCCIPIVTIGAATTALYTLALRMQRREDYALFRDFFRAFRQNFKQAAALTGILLAALLLLAADARLLTLGMVPGGRAGLCLICALAALVVMTGSYVFALLAFFDDPVLAHLRNAVLMSLRYFPRTVLVLLTSFGPAAAAAAVYQNTHLPAYLVLVFGAALSARINSFFLYPVFQKHLPADPEVPA